MAEQRVARVAYRLKAVKPGAKLDAYTLGSGGGQLPDYEAGGEGWRARGWRVSSAGVNSTVEVYATNLRNRSRHARQNNAWIKKAVRSAMSNLIGTGIRPRSRHPDPAVRTALQEAWSDWTLECDADGTQSFYGLQRMGAAARFTDGEVFIRFRPRRPEDGLVVPLQLQIIEADQCPLDYNRDLGGRRIVRQGIELDALGRRAAYYFYRQHPGDFSTWAMPGDAELVRVPADQIMHWYNPERPGQLRGVSELGAALVRAMELDQYEDAELVRKKVAALFAGFLTPGLDEEGESVLDADDYIDEGVATIRMEPGGFKVLPVGSTLTFSEPADVGGNYAEFLKWNLRAVAAAVSAPYEQVTGNLEDVNYSSIRAGLLAYRREILQEQENGPIFQLCLPTWRRFVSAAAMEGIVTARAFSADPRAFYRAQWVGQGWEWTDPEKEGRAARDQVRAGLNSRDNVAASRGLDAEEIDRQIAAEQERQDSAGLVYDVDARKVSAAGVTQARPAGSQTLAEDEEQEPPAEPAPMAQPDDEADEEERESA